MTFTRNAPSPDSRPSRVRAAFLAAAAFGLSLAVASCAAGPEPIAAPPPESDAAYPAVPRAQEQPAPLIPPSPAEKRVQTLGEAAVLLDRGEAAAAVAVIAALAAAQPDSVELRLAGAAALVSDGALDAARAEVAAASTVFPNDVQPLVLGARLAAFAGDATARKTYLDRALAAAPADAAVLAAWGDYHLDARNWSKAEDFYSRSQRADPASADAAAGLGRALYRKGKYDDSEAQYTRALELEPASPLVLSDRSRARYQLGKYAESAADLDAAIALSPDSAWLYLDRGRFRLDSGDTRGAETDLDRAILLDPGYFLPYALRAGIHEETGRDEAAFSDYRRVIELYPDYWFAFEGAGATAFRLGRWPEAAAGFKESYVHAADRYEYAIAASIALWRSGKPKEASAYAGSIAPRIDREKNGIYWAILRLLQDQNDATSELELRIQAEKTLDLKAAMLFYLGEYWLCRGKTALAMKYLALSGELGRVACLEYRLLMAELRRLEAAGANG